MFSGRMVTSLRCMVRSKPRTMRSGGSGPSSQIATTSFSFSSPAPSISAG
jgi:hypothetical protein